MLDVILKRFDQPDEIRTFPKGKFELIHIGGMTIGRATYQPGWKWSVDVGTASGVTMCPVEHVGMVVSGKATAAMEDGRIIEMRAAVCFSAFSGGRELRSRQEMNASCRLKENSLLAACLRR